MTFAMKINTMTSTAPVGLLNMVDLAWQQAAVLDVEEGERVVIEVRDGVVVRAETAPGYLPSSAEIAFIRFVDEVDALMRDMWCVDTVEAEISEIEIDEALAAGVTPVEFVERFGQANGLLPH